MALLQYAFLVALALGSAWGDQFQASKVSSGGSVDHESVPDMLDIIEEEDEAIGDEAASECAATEEELGTAEAASLEQGAAAVEELSTPEVASLEQRAAAEEELGAAEEQGAVAEELATAEEQCAAAEELGTPEVVSLEQRASAEEEMGASEEQGAAAEELATAEEGDATNPVVVKEVLKAGAKRVVTTMGKQPLAERAAMKRTSLHPWAQRIKTLRATQAAKTMSKGGTGRQQAGAKSIPGSGGARFGAIKAPKLSIEAKLAAYVAMATSGILYGTHMAYQAGHSTPDEDAKEVARGLFYRLTAIGRKYDTTEARVEAAEALREMGIYENWQEDCPEMKDLRILAVANENGRMVGTWEPPRYFFGPIQYVGEGLRRGRLGGSGNDVPKEDEIVIKAVQRAVEAIVAHRATLANKSRNMFRSKALAAAAKPDEDRKAIAGAP